MPVSNPDKILFPEIGLTKLEFVRYYGWIAPLMVPHVAGRPLTMVRFPEGAGGEEFYQKEAQEYYPEYVSRVDVEVDDEFRQYIAIENAASLVYLANLTAIPHIWICRVPDVRMADMVVWDLDPAGTVTFDHVKTGAKLLRHLLGELGITPYVKLTGSRGLHVSAVLDQARPVGDVFEFSKAVSVFIARTLPRAFTTEFSKVRRGDRLYLDYLRNRYAQSFAAPYAVRSVPSASVAWPIKWSDLDTDLDPTHVTVRTAGQWHEGREEFLRTWQKKPFSFADSRRKLHELLSR